MKLTVAQLAEQIGAELVMPPDGNNAYISGVEAVETAGGNRITFFTDSRYTAALEKSAAGAVIVAERIEDLAKPQLIVKDVNTALIEVLNIFAPELNKAAEGIDPTAKVSRNAKIAEGVSIGPTAIIDDGVEIGLNSVISSGCRIGENSKLGKNCRLDSNVVIYHNCTLGNNVVIQANSTIGSTGFGYYFTDGRHKLIPHNGIVVIEDFVEIGANCCVDRAKFGETRIGAGTKIDNFVQIAHSVVIGKSCLIAALTGIAGSCKIGDSVVLAGQVGVNDNIKIGDGTLVAAKSGVTHDIAAGQKIFGMPAYEIKKAWRTIGLTRRLPKLAEQLKQLRARVKKLEIAENDKD